MQSGPWEHGHVRTTKEPQVVRPYSKIISSNTQYCKWAMAYDSGSQIADGADAAPIWWRAEADYPAWLDYSLPAALLEGELPNIPYSMDKLTALMPTRVDITSRHYTGDISGTTGCNVYASFSLRSGTTEIAKFYAVNASGLYWGVADSNDPHYYHDVTGYAIFREWNTLGTVIGKQNLTPDNIRFFVRCNSWVNLYTDITFRMRCGDYLAILFPEYVP